jgi:hypothetical protein
MTNISADWLVGIVCALCALMVLAIDLSYSAGVKDGMAAANGVCRITCEVKK